MTELRHLVIASSAMLLACSYCMADAEINPAESPGGKAQRPDLQMPTIASDYFDSNWKITTDKTKQGANDESQSEISSQYFDANWALFRDQRKKVPDSADRSGKK